jgi:glycosyltransferase involved in cell wall biosynthesis
VTVRRATPIDVSVVVPVLDMDDTVGACVEALLAQDYPADHYEVVVVDNGSSDRTLDVLRPYPVTVLHEPRRGPASARNRGVDAASGQLVAFTDADCIPTRAWLAALATRFGDASTNVAAGLSLPLDPGSSAIAAYAARIGQYDSARLLSHPRFPHAHTANVAFRHSALRAVGGFDPDFRTGEGADLFHRMRKQGLLRFTVERRAVVFYRTRADGRALMRQNFHYGRGNAMFRDKHRAEIPRRPGARLIAWGRRVASGRRLLRTPPPTPFSRRALLVVHLARETAMLAGDSTYPVARRCERAARIVSPDAVRHPLRSLVRAWLLLRVTLFMAVLPIVMRRPLPRAVAVIERMRWLGMRSRPEQEQLLLGYIRWLGQVNRWSFRDNCAVRALTLFAFLGSGPTPLELRLGFESRDDVDGRVKPGRRHLWLVRDGAPLYESEPVAEYTVVYSHSSPSA